MKPKIFAPLAYGKYFDIEFPNGRRYCRVCRYSKTDGLFVVVANRRYLESELELVGKENSNGGKGSKKF